jgi:CHAT domain-containing protein
MIRFYRAISRGGRYEDALRRAKLELITKPETAFPYFWAGFVLLHG